MLRRRAGWGPQWQASKGGGGGGPERVRGGIALWGVAEGPLVPGETVNEHGTFVPPSRRVLT